MALCIHPGPGFQKGGTAFRASHILAGRLRGEKGPPLFAPLTGLGLIVPGLAIPVFTQVFFDDVLTGRHAEWMFNILLAMGITMLLQGALILPRSWCLTRWQGNMTIGDSSRFFWHILHLPMEFFSSGTAVKWRLGWPSMSRWPRF